jgi:hypothetical protein
MLGAHVGKVRISHTVMGRTKERVLHQSLKKLKKRKLSPGADARILIMEHFVTEATPNCSIINSKLKPCFTKNQGFFTFKNFFNISLLSVILINSPFMKKLIAE